MYIVTKNKFFRFIKFEGNFIICSNGINIYQIPFTKDIKFLTIKEEKNYDLLDLILQKLSPNVKDQINFTTLNSTIFNRLIIKKLEASSYMNDQLLQGKNCPTGEYLWSGLVELNTNENKNITDVRFMAATLRILHASRSDCGIDQAGIQGLKLVKLNASNNKKIKDVRFMAATLRILDAYGNCGIDQAGIQGIQLVQLKVSDNPTIKDVRFMAPTLRILDASWSCGIDQAGIQGLQLVKLNAEDNKKIKDVRFMAPTLRILHAS